MGRGRVWRGEQGSDKIVVDRTGEGSAAAAASLSVCACRTGGGYARVGGVLVPRACVYCAYRGCGRKRARRLRQAIAFSSPTKNQPTRDTSKSIITLQ